MTATHQVLTSGVRWVRWMLPKRWGSACRRAIERPVRDAGMIVVCVEAMADGGDREQHHPVPVAHHPAGDLGERELLGLGPDRREPLGAGEGDHGVGDGDVADEQDERRPQAGAAARAVPGLLAEVHRGLPAPVGEDAQEQSAGECRAAALERIEPARAPGSPRRAGWCRRTPCRGRPRRRRAGRRPGRRSAGSAAGPRCRCPARTARSSPGSAGSPAASGPRRCRQHRRRRP